MRALLLTLVAMGVGGCTHAVSPPPTKGSTVVVVGVQSDNMGGLVGALHIVTKVDGAVTSDDLVTPPTGGSRVGFPAPWEKQLTPEAGKTAGQVDVEVDAFAGSDASSPMLIQRLASTEFVTGKTMLLRVHLESRCVVFPTGPASDAGADGGGTPGPLSGPSCSAPETCINGACQSDAIAPTSLEPYASNWATNEPDVCKPLNAGPPNVQAGSGQTDYLPLPDGTTLQAERGPQGGHHIWIAVRQRNLKQSGSTTTVSAVAPGTGVAIPPSAFVFTFDPDEGGYCKLYGLRYQLDNGGIDYTQFLGHPLDVTIVIADPAGTMGSVTAHIDIAPTLLNP